MSFAGEAKEKAPRVRRARGFGANAVLVAIGAALLVAGAGRVASAQQDPRPDERGLPTVQLFETEDYNSSQLFSVAVAGRRLYAGVLSGVAVYDGAHWSLATSERAVFAIEADGRRVIAGGPDALWEFVDSPSGPVLSSLLAALPEAERAIGDVRSIHGTRDGTFFVVTDRALLELRGAKLRVLERVESDSTRRGFVTRDGFFVTSSHGLAAYRADGSRSPEEANEVVRFVGSRHATILTDTQDATLVAIEGEGLFVHEGPSRFRPVARTGGGEFFKADLSSAKLLRSGQVAIASQRSGVFLLNADLSFDRQFGQSDGLATEQIVALAEDQEGGLWAAGETAIARLDFGSALTVIDHRLGIDGTVTYVSRAQGEVLISTSAGLFRIPSAHPKDETEVPTHRDRAVRVAGIPPRVWYTLSVGDSVLVGTASGIFEMGRTGAPRLLPGTRGWVVYALAQDQEDPNRVFVGSRNGLSQLRRRATGWFLDTAIEGVPRYVRCIVSRPGGILYLGTVFGGLARVDLRATPHGIEILDSGEYTVELMGSRLVALRADPQQLSLVNEETRTLEPDSRAKLLPRLAVALAAGAEGRLWMGGNGVVVAGVSDAQQVLAASKNVQRIVTEPDGVVWMASQIGLWRFVDRPQEKPATESPTVGRIFVNGAPAPEATLRTRALPFGFERLRLDISPNTFRTDVAHEFRLHPLEANWNSDRQGSSAEYSQLAEGRYELFVRDSTRTASTPTAVYAFDVLPPWYRSGTARAGQLMALGALFYAGVRWRTRTFKRRARELEAAVTEKTEALVSAMKQLDELARHDELTGLFNRRHFDEALEREWARAQRAGQPVALAIVDLDHFKALNDTFGHPEGDRALQRVAPVIEAAARRPGDVAARFGGEEFVLLLPGTSYEGALSVAEDVRKAIVALKIGNPGHGDGIVTASVGVASTARAAGDAAAFVEAADQALYRAKRAGRNRVDAVSIAQ